MGAVAMPAYGGMPCSAKCSVKPHGSIACTRRSAASSVKGLATDTRPIGSRGTSGPEETINGRIEHLRGSALGFRNPTNHIAETQRIQPRPHP